MKRATAKEASAIVVLAAAIWGLAGDDAQAQAGNCPGGLRKINVGVSVTPPNVVHTTPFVAKKLGYFAKRCVDANIVEFEGGAAGTAITAVAQGTAISNLNSAAIAQGVKGKQIWGLAPRPPQSYVVAENIKTAADLKGKRLSAAGGIGGFNWLIGRDVLQTAGLTVNDAQFISQGTAGRLPGLLTGQLDGVVLHPEDTYLALQKKPGVHVLTSITDLMPKYSFNSYGASDAFIARDRALLVDTVTAMIEANRTIYRDKDTVIPIMVEATQKPREAVEYAWGELTKNCVWSVNTGHVRDRIEWMMQREIEVGDVDPGKKLGYDQIVDEKLAQEAVEKAGGPVTINGCKD
jgi:ABC-type nitrate/sulfonate/bicarbonate transport system substrate-binding protein